MNLRIGHKYTRNEIQQEVGGGDLQSYLPHSAGDVLCGCFDPRRNSKAPFEIDLGSGRDVIRYAKRLHEQGNYVPVFLKNGTFKWEYVGNFRAVQYSTESSDLHPAKQSRRPDAVAVLYLEIDSTNSDPDVTDDPAITTQSAIEGGSGLVTHVKRERNRQLIDAKRRAYRKDHRQLQCEVCGLKEDALPPKIGEGCYEVHHLQPLGTRVAASVTKLDDLAIVCANCHRLIHRSSPMLSIKALARLRKPEQI